MRARVSCLSQLMSEMIAVAYRGLVEVRPKGGNGGGRICFTDEGDSGAKCRPLVEAFSEYHRVASAAIEVNFGIHRRFLPLATSRIEGR